MIYKLLEMGKTLCSFGLIWLGFDLGREILREIKAVRALLVEKKEEEQL